MSHMDILMEQLRHYDEVQLLEMLDITSEELLQAFGNKVWDRKDYIEREIEFIPLNDDDEEIVEDFTDGFQIYQVNDNGEEEYDI